jgi:hypothetical protein
MMLNKGDNILARAYAKCKDCGQIMWIGNNDKPPQAVQCICGKTRLDESGVKGNSTVLKQEEIDFIEIEDMK